MTAPLIVVEDVPRANCTFFFTPFAKMKPAARAPTMSAAITRLVPRADLNCLSIIPLLLSDRRSRLLLRHVRLQLSHGTLRKHPRRHLVFDPAHVSLVHHHVDRV